MTTNALIGAFALLAAMSSGQDAAVPVEEEPDHRTVFKNDYVQAFRVTLEPGRPRACTRTRGTMPRSG